MPHADNPVGVDRDALEEGCECLSGAIGDDEGADDPQSGGEGTIVEGKDTMIEHQDRALDRADGAPPDHLGGQEELEEVNWIPLCGLWPAKRWTVPWQKSQDPRVRWHVCPHHSVRLKRSPSATNGSSYLVARWKARYLEAR